MAKKKVLLVGPGRKWDEFRVIWGLEQDTFFCVWLDFWKKLKICGPEVEIRDFGPVIEKV